MLEDRHDAARAYFRDIQDRLHVEHGKTRPAIEWSRGRSSMAAGLLDDAQQILREAQRTD
jgi:hypothetical protein